MNRNRPPHIPDAGTGTHQTATGDDGGRVWGRPSPHVDHSGCMPLACCAALVPRPHRQCPRYAKPLLVLRKFLGEQALEGMVATDDDAERAGRMIAGDATVEQVIGKLQAQYRAKVKTEN